jgi:hypothetical protein
MKVRWLEETLMKQQPPPRGESILAVCEFNPESNEKPVCITLRAFDTIRKSVEKQDAEKQDAEPFNEKQP